MNRIAILVASFALSAPLSAHEALSLDSTLHQLMHATSNNLLIVLGLAAITGIGAVVARRAILEKRLSRTGA